MATTRNDLSATEAGSKTCYCHVNGCCLTDSVVAVPVKKIRIERKGPKEKIRAYLSSSFTKKCWGPIIIFYVHKITIKLLRILDNNNSSSSDSINNNTTSSNTTNTTQKWNEHEYGNLQKVRKVNWCLFSFSPNSIPIHLSDRLSVINIWQWLRIDFCSSP